jgi:hypothetical protein
VKRYRRIEITAFRRRVTVSSGEIVLNNPSNHSVPTKRGVWLNDADSGEPIEFESAEGQLILADAVRSLERRLSPEARAAMCVDQELDTSNRSNPNRFHLKLQSLYQLICPKAQRFTRKEK